MKPIPYSRQNVTRKDIDEVVKVLKSDFLTQGPVIKELENDFCKLTGSKYSAAVSSGTAALHLSAMALGVKPGDKVITTPITFAASANCIRYCGGDIEFADIDPLTYILDFETVKKLLESKPKGTYKGLVIVDFAGYPVNLEKFRNLADEFGLWILEDACHSPGAYFIDSNNKKQICGNGKFADLSVFSFHPVKHIAAGEGGMVTTNNQNYFENIIRLRTHGVERNPEKLTRNDGQWYYEITELGYNYRITDIQSALAKSQLKRLNESIKLRHEIADRYISSFRKTGIILPEIKGNFLHALHLFVIKSKGRNKLYEYLRKNNVFTQIHYIPLHYMPYYKNLGWKVGDFPEAENYYQNCLSLPMFPSLTKEEQDYVIEMILNYRNHC